MKYYGVFEKLTCKCESIKSTFMQTLSCNLLIAVLKLPLIIDGGPCTEMCQSIVLMSARENKMCKRHWKQLNDINNSFGKGSITRLGSAGGALVYVVSSLQLLLHEKESMNFSFMLYVYTQ
ncbi:hypothetical protein NMG60_11012010 [Bertholletia excelsa]